MIAFRLKKENGKSKKMTEQTTRKKYNERNAFKRGLEKGIEEMKKHLDLMENLWDKKGSEALYSERYHSADSNFSLLLGHSYQAGYSNNKGIISLKKEYQLLQERADKSRSKEKPASFSKTKEELLMKRLERDRRCSEDFEEDYEPSEQELKRTAY